VKAWGKLAVHSKPSPRTFEHDKRACFTSVVFAYFCWRTAPAWPTTQRVFDSKPSRFSFLLVTLSGESSGPAPSICGRYRGERIKILQSFGGYAHLAVSSYRKLLFHPEANPLKGVRSSKLTISDATRVCVYWTRLISLCGSCPTATLQLHPNSKNNLQTNRLSKSFSVG